MIRWILLLSGLILALATVGCGGSNSESVAPTPTAPAAEQLAVGYAEFQTRCTVCHALSVGGKDDLGPVMAEIGRQAATRVDGLDARAYIRQSILEPSVYLVDGYKDKMPSNYGERIDDETLEAIVAYLLTLE